MWPPSYVINNLLSLMHIWESRKRKLKKEVAVCDSELPGEGSQTPLIKAHVFTHWTLFLLGFITGNLPVCHSIWKECGGLVYLQIKNNKNSNTCYRNLKAHSIWDQLTGAKALRSWEEARESLFCSPFQQWMFIPTSDSAPKEPLKAPEESR